MGTPEKLTGYLTRELSLDKDRASIILYGSRIVIFTTANLLTITAVSYLMGVFKYAVAAVITNALLRNYAGGAHAKTPLGCNIMGTLVFTGLGYLAAKINWPFGLNLFLYGITGVFSYFAVYKFAPADTPQKPIRDKQFIYKQRTKSFLIVLVWVIFAIGVLTGLLSIDQKILTASTFGLLWASFTFTPQGYKILEGFSDI